MLLTAALYRSTSTPQRKACSRTTIIICDDFPGVHSKVAT